MPYVPQMASYAIPSPLAQTIRKQSGEVSPDGHSIKLYGRIDFHMLRLLQHIDQKKIRFFTITSLGGDPSAALQIGQMILRHNVTVIISGPCASACASDIAVMAKKLVIEKDGLLLFHNTATSLKIISESGNNVASNAHFSTIKSLEEKLYTISHLDHKLLTFPQIAIGTTCYRYIYRHGAWSDSQYKSILVAAYIPDDILKKFGVRVVSHNDTSATDVSKRLLSYGVSIPPSSLAMINAKNYLIVYNQRLQGLPVC